MSDCAVAYREEETDAKIQQDVWTWAKGQAIGWMDLSLGARECWRNLYGFPAGKCYPSHCWIAFKMGKSVSAVRRYLRELEDGGYIRITQRIEDQPRWPANPDHEFAGPRPPRGQRSNMYTILDQEDLIARAQHIMQEREAKQNRNR